MNNIGQRSDESTGVWQLARPIDEPSTGCAACRRYISILKTTCFLCNGCPTPFMIDIDNLASAQITSSSRHHLVRRAMATDVSRPFVTVFTQVGYLHLAKKHLFFSHTATCTESSSWARCFDDPQCGKNGRHNNIMEAVITINTDTPYFRNIPRNRLWIVFWMHYYHLWTKIALTIVD